MEKASLMQKEIEDKRKLSPEVKDSIDRKVLYNLLISICIMTYICSINIIYLTLSKELFSIISKVFAVVLITETVIIFEIAYRKDSGALCITGIESLISNIFILYIPYLHLHTSPLYSNIAMIIPIFICIYYVIKSIIIYKVMKSKYENNLSDVKEILKEEKKKSYLDEDSTKILKKEKEKRKK